MFSAALVQVVDTAGVQRSMMAKARAPATHILDYDRWDSIVRENSLKKIFFYPQFLCGSEPPFDTLLPVMRYAGVRGLAINTGYVARHRSECRSPEQDVDSAPSGSVFVFSRAEFEGIEEVYKVLGEDAAATCSASDGIIFCLSDKG